MVEAEVKKEGRIQPLSSDKDTYWYLHYLAATNLRQEIGLYMCQEVVE